MNRPSSGRPDADVIVAGAGIAGLTACVLLARAGLRVVCIDPVAFPRERVGESLDWAAPALLDRIGLPVDRLIGDEIGTRKREVRGISTTGAVLIGRPVGWMSWWPLRFRLETVHIDRARFDCALYELANSAGVRFIWDRIVRVDVDGDRVMGCSTQSGTLAATWFLDASGRARMFARALGIDRLEGGPKRVAVWAHRDVPQRVEGTVLHLNDASDPLSWAWEIPVSPHRQSVGVVLPELDFRLRHDGGNDPAQILSAAVAEFAGLAATEPGQLDGVKVRGFRGYAHSRVSGANWMMIGEAAAFVDPLTSTGISAAMRHAAEAADIIRAGHPTSSARALRRFDRRLRSIANLYNNAIEELLYGTLLRQAFGLSGAARAYVILGFGMSVLYGRIGARGWLRHGALLTIAAVYSMWTRGCIAIARHRHDLP